MCILSHLLPVFPYYPLQSLYCQKILNRLLDSISKFSSFDKSNTLQKQEFVLGVGQSYDYYFGADEFRNNADKKPIAGEIIYQDELKTYQESFQIDWDKYATFYSVNSPADDFLDEMKKLVKEANNIAQALKLQQSTKAKKNTEK